MNTKLQQKTNTMFRSIPIPVPRTTTSTSSSIMTTPTSPITTETILMSHATPYLLTGLAMPYTSKKTTPTTSQLPYTPKPILHTAVTRPWWFMSLT